MDNFEKHYVILKHNVLVHRIGRKSILVKLDRDYSRQKMISLTDEGVQLLEFIRVKRSLIEVFHHFSVPSSEQKSFFDYFEFLAKEGYVILWDTSIEGKEFIGTIIREEWRQDRTPFGATIELTPKCNFNCIHCYLGKKRSNASEMSTFQIKSIFDTLAEAGMLVLFLTGGEPLLRKDFIELYIYARKKGFLIEILTNGYLLDEELLNIFLEYPPLEIDISLYGINDDKYKEVTGCDRAFSKIKDNIRIFRENGINVSLKSPIFTNLSEDLKEMSILANELGTPLRVNFDIVPTVDNESKNYLQLDAKKAVEFYVSYSRTYEADIKILHESLQDKNNKLARTRYACAMGRCNCFITYEGKFAPCVETRAKGISIFEKSFKEIWEEIGRISYEELKNVDEKEYKCLTCDKISICKSCPAVRERKYGSPQIVKEEDCRFATELYNTILGNNIPT